jgi:2-keto-4-pentenoate hydratase
MVSPEFVDRLAAARAAGDHCPSWLPGALTFDEALEVQLALLDRELERAGERESLAGWKVGLTSERARSSVGADVRPFGYLLASHVFESGATIDASPIHQPSIEPELCFTFRSRLSGQVSRDQVADAVDRIAAGFEINERRAGGARPDMPAMVTDRLTQWGIVHGSGVPLAEAGDLGAIRCTLSCDDKSVYEGVSRDELDDHLESIARLAAALGSFERAIEPGHRVITGAFARRDCAAGQHWRARYDPIGAVEIRLS